MLRTLLAPNASVMTLDGTRTFLVGERRIAIIDPGPDDAEHLRRIAAAVDGAPATILLTHQHPDHAAGARSLARMLGEPPRSAAANTLADGDVIPTDAGALHVVATPGHTPDHIALHWPDQSAIFVGDLMMGGLDTALVAPPEGSLADYLASLDRLAALNAAVLYPAHGPEVRDPAAAIDRYRAHRRHRLSQVRQAISDGVQSRDGLVAAVYGAELPEGLQDFARAAVDAYVVFLREEEAAE